MSKVYSFITIQYFDIWPVFAWIILSYLHMKRMSAVTSIYRDKESKWKEESKEKITLQLLKDIFIHCFKFIGMFQCSFRSYRLLQSITVAFDLKWTCPLALTFDPLTLQWEEAQVKGGRVQQHGCWNSFTIHQNKPGRLYFYD